MDGSNCQRFAYGVLGLFGLKCPPFRSSDLWEDNTDTRTVPLPRPLDLLLFSANESAFGAHVGIWMSPDEVLHLCKEVGTPTVWPLGAFSSRARYQTLVGAKRVTSTVDPAV